MWKSLRSVVVALATVIVAIACGSDHPTSPSSGSPAPTLSSEGPFADTSPSSGSQSPTTHTAGAAQTTAALGPPAAFRITNRLPPMENGNLLDFRWDSNGWEIGSHFELSYAGITRQVGHNTAWREQIDLDLSPGRSYTVSVRTVTPAGQASAPAQLVFETTPPSPPTNLRQLSTHRTQSGEFPDQISFSAGRDNSGVVRRYYVFVDGKLVDHIGLSGETTQFSLFRTIFDGYVSTPCGPTALQLRPEDSSFNVGPPSAALTVFFPEYEHCPPPHRDR
jgi:hypothetical protein